MPVTTSTGWSRSYGASLGVGYELDLWDRLGQATDAQHAQAEAARTDIAAARLLIRSQVAEAYWTLAAIRAQQPLAEAQLARLLGKLRELLGSLDESSAIDAAS